MDLGDSLLCASTDYLSIGTLTETASRSRRRNLNWPLLLPLAASCTRFGRWKWTFSRPLVNDATLVWSNHATGHAMPLPRDRVPPGVLHCCAGDARRPRRPAASVAAGAAEQLCPCREPTAGPRRAQAAELRLLRPLRLRWNVFTAGRLRWNVHTAGRARAHRQRRRRRQQHVPVFAWRLR